MPTPGSPLASAFGPLHVPAAHEYVLARLRRAIQLGEVLPGERLPKERELAELFKVSRITVREALKVLQAEGAIESRRGQGGGNLIMPGVSERSFSGIDLDRRLKRAQDVKELRLVLEPTAASLAASRALPKEVKQVRYFHEQLQESTGVDEFRRADSGFHLAVAAASGNTLLSTAIDEARSAMFLVLDAGDFTILHSSSCNAHGAILDAIEGGDASAAAAQMRSHIEEASAEIAAAIAQQAF